MNFLFHFKKKVWPETLWPELVTTTHHVWFIPLLLWASYGHGGFPWRCIRWSFISTACLMYIASILTTEYIDLGEPEPYYFNINMAHGFWKEIKIDFLHYANEQHYVIYQLYVNFLGLVLNTPYQIMFILLSRKLDAHFQQKKKKEK